MKSHYYTCLLCSILTLNSCDDKKSELPPQNESQITKQASTVQVKACGYGKTKEQAIYNALQLAKEQTHGVQITKDSFLRQAHIQLATSDQNNECLQKNLDITTEYKLQQVTDKTKDIISYDILHEDFKEISGWKMELMVKLPAPHKDRFENKIALTPTSLNLIQKQLSQLGFPESLSASLSRQISEPICAAFTSSQEFVLLERDNDTVQQERNLLKTDQIALTDKTKINNLKISDFVLNIQVDAGYFKIITHTFPDTGQTIYRAQWELAFSAKLIESASDAVLTRVSSSIKGKKNSFSKDACISACLQDIKDQLHNKTHEAGGLLAFQLGYPALKHMNLLSETPQAYRYSFMICGPHLLTQNQHISLYKTTNHGKQLLGRGVVQLYEANSNQMIIQTDQVLPELEEGSLLTLAPYSLETETHTGK